MASTPVGIVAHVSSVDAMSKSLPVTAKLLKTMKRVKKTDSIFIGSEHPKAVNNYFSSQQLQYFKYDHFKLCVYSYFHEFITIILL